MTSPGTGQEKTELRGAGTPHPPPPCISTAKIKQNDDGQAETPGLDKGVLLHDPQAKRLLRELIPPQTREALGYYIPEAPGCT